jgi:hypothetical protein
MDRRNSYLSTLSKKRKERQNATLTNRDKDRLNIQINDLKFKIKELNRDEINKIEDKERKQQIAAVEKNEKNQKARIADRKEEAAYHRSQKKRQIQAAKDYLAGKEKQIKAKARIHSLEENSNWAVFEPPAPIRREPAREPVREQVEQNRRNNANQNAILRAPQASFFLSQASVKAAAEHRAKVASLATEIPHMSLANTIRLNAPRRYSQHLARLAERARELAALKAEQDALKAEQDAELAALKAEQAAELATLDASLQGGRCTYRRKHKRSRTYRR